VASVALHVAIAAWVATREPPAPRKHAEPVEFAVLGLDELPQDSVEVAPPAPAASPEPAAEARPRTTQRARPGHATIAPPSSASSAPGIVPEPASTPSQVEMAPPVATAEAAPSIPRRLDLSPLAAALTLRDSWEAPASGQCPALADGGCGATAAGNATAEARSTPSEQDRLIALRKELKLEPRSDGSYVYNGAGMRATVLPDGRVEFQDKIRDLNTIMEALASDGQRNTAEKRRFMADTAALREQLALSAEAKNQRLGLSRLRSALERVWHDNASSLPQKRAALFALWDECASDASGSAAQASIEAFIRQQLPLGSPLAFSASELAQLNRRRVSRRSFDPYAAADAGTLPG
jgi:hypothetical protein